MRTGNNKLTVTATELARRTGELPRLAEHGTIITVVDAKHPDWVRAIIVPPPVPPGSREGRGSGSAGSAD